MSRALDKDSQISLQKEEAQKVYASLTKELCKPRTELLEIEFLGKSHPLPPGQNFLLEESSIAIPKIKLVQAFTIARPILFKYNQKCLEKELGKEVEEELRNATAIILLMDPEHLTAANTRKRIILSNLKNSKVDIKTLINLELQFVNSFLTARLHRHTKSPTLWSHRRWILSLSFSHSPPIGPHSQPYNILQDFKTVILIAADRHPKNYYAWSHARWLIEKFEIDEKPLIPLIQDWALRNPSDTSGFSFLYFLLSPPYAAVERREVYKKVLDLTISFRWSYESVWVFLRTLAAYDDGVGKNFEQEVGEFGTSYGGSEDLRVQERLKSAVVWYREHAQEIR